MRLLSDLAILTRHANTATARMDVGASLAAAQQSLEQANRVMAAAAVANDPVFEAARVRATATVNEARQLPMAIGMDVVVELDLLVMLAGGVPLPVTRTEPVAPIRLAQVAPGSRVAISLVPGRPETVRLEWAA